MSTKPNCYLCARRRGERCSLGPGQTLHQMRKPVTGLCGPSAHYFQEVDKNARISAISPPLDAATHHPGPSTSIPTKTPRFTANSPDRKRLSANDKDEP